MAAPATAARLDQIESFPEVAHSTLPEVVYYAPENDTRTGSEPLRPELRGVTAPQPSITAQRIESIHQRSDSNLTQHIDEDLYSAQLSPHSNYSTSAQSSRIRLDAESFRSPPSSAHGSPSQNSRERPEIQDRGFSVVSDLSGLNAVVEYVSNYLLSHHVIPPE
jgi:hypothetical protein